MAHLFLGHLDADKKINVPQRHVPKHAQQELEAESVAFIVCERQGVKSKSQTYLPNFVNADTVAEHLDVYQVTRAAGQIETLPGLAAHTNFSQPARPTRGQKKTDGNG